MTIKARKGYTGIAQTATILSIMLVLITGSLLAACGQTAPTALPGLLTGKVVAGPTCPVERVGQTCPPAPVPNRKVEILDAKGSVAATTTTDASGHFSLSLAPGSYVVRVPIVPGQIGMSQVSPGNITVVSGQTVSVTIELDTGIR